MRSKTYEEFVEKFKPKLTTDDCATPEAVYEAVVRWVDANILPLDGVEIIRPFWPGCDYQTVEYPEGCVVIDNPPFSILTKIRRWYQERGIKYFLFAPTLTLTGAFAEETCFLCCGASVTYENGAVVATSFVTNLDCGGTLLWCAGGLTKEIEAAQGATKVTKTLPQYRYPDNVVSAATLWKIAKRGVDFKIHKDSAAFIRRLDSQVGSGKAIFGNGLLISDRAAADRAAADRAAAERAAAERAAAERAAADWAAFERTVAEWAAKRGAIEWELSEREKEIIRNLK